MSNFTVVAIVRNQAPYILEWVAHHLSIGVEDFVLCVHGSSDGTAKVTRRLAAMGYAVHVKINVEGDDPWASACSQIADLPEIRSADWIARLDVEDYLNIHAGTGRIDELTETAPDAFRVDSVLFGSNGEDAIGDGQVRKTFVKREVAASDALGSPRTIARSLDLLVNAEGASSVDPKVAQVNRYACKSVDHLGVQLLTPASRSPDVIAKAWSQSDRNDETDASISRYDRWVEKYSRMLKSDRQLKRATTNGLNWHKERAAQARTEEALSALLDGARR